MIAVALTCVSLLIPHTTPAAEPGEDDPVDHPSAASGTVVIDGRRWRIAPPGTPETGPPGSRIVLDGRLYLDADTTPESFFAVPPPTEPEPVTERRPTSPRPRADPPPVVRDDPPEAVRPPAEAPATRKPTAEQPTDEQPAAREPATEQSTAEQSTAEQPAFEQPAARKPATEQPAARKPATEQPAVEQPASELPAVEQPAARKPATEQSTVKQPAAEQPATEKPARAGEREPTSGQNAVAAAPRVPEPAATAADPAGKTSDDALVNDEPGFSGKISPETIASEVTEPELTGSDARLDATRRRAALGERTGTPAEDVREPTVPSFLQALRLPAAARPSSREFGYIDATSLRYDRGGSGVMLESSVVMSANYRLLARIGTATDYQELLLGASWYATPPVADRLTLVLTFGVETARFESESQSADTSLSDTGLYFGGAARMVVNERFELQAGLGHRSLFDGDPVVFGGAAFHASSRVDIVSRLELGGNDTLGFGVRYYY